jgi:hypothetical protein
LYLYYVADKLTVSLPLSPVHGVYYYDKNLFCNRLLIHTSTSFQNSHLYSTTISHKTLQCCFIIVRMFIMEITKISHRAYHKRLSKFCKALQYFNAIFFNADMVLL